MSLSPESRAYIKDFATRGVPPERIAEETGFTLDAVLRVVGGPRYMRELQRQGYGENQIAAMMGVPTYAVKNALKKLKDSKVGK